MAIPNSKKVDQVLEIQLWNNYKNKFINKHFIDLNRVKRNEKITEIIKMDSDGGEIEIHLLLKNFGSKLHLKPEKIIHNVDDVCIFIII